MSGGVDSAAAALLLSQAGHPVVGVSMQVWDYRKNTANHGVNAKKATCCAPADFNDAREVADKLGFPYYVYDFEGSFEKEVIAPFVDAYLNGETPNPCILCNQKVKFSVLRERAALLGAEYVATGHYAQILQRADGSKGLYTAADRAKDQTYFLFGLSQAELDHTIFPVGGMEKPQVREVLSISGMSMATKGESQDICFVTSEVGEFIEKYADRYSDRQIQPGEFITKAGEKLGSHSGVHQFTVGQRRGLNVSGRERLYVLSVDQDSGTVVLGEKSDLDTKCFQVRDVNFINQNLPLEFEALVKVRYRSPGYLARVKKLSPTRVEVEFFDQGTAISPGQAAVFYATKKDHTGFVEVFGGGTISK